MPEDLKNLSRKGWTTSTYTNEDIQTSAIMRIADATEQMAAASKAITTDYKKMKDDKEYFERRNREMSERNKKLEASNASLRGVITRMKNKEKKAKEARS